MSCTGGQSFLLSTSRQTGRERLGWGEDRYQSVCSRWWFTWPCSIKWRSWGNMAHPSCVVSGEIIKDGIKDGWRCSLFGPAFTKVDLALPACLSACCQPAIQVLWTGCRAGACCLCPRYKYLAIHWPVRVVLLSSSHISPWLTKCKSTTTPQGTCLALNYESRSSISKVVKGAKSFSCDHKNTWVARFAVALRGFDQPALTELPKKCGVPEIAQDYI